MFAIIEALIIGLIVPVAYWLGQNFEFFPRNIIPIWTIARWEDVLPTAQFMGTAALFVFFFSHLFFGSKFPSTARRAAIEIYAFAIAVTVFSAEGS